MGGHSETSWEQTLGPLAGFWGKGKFCLSQSLEPLPRETFGIGDKVNKLVLHVQQICLGGHSHVYCNGECLFIWVPHCPWNNVLTFLSLSRPCGWDNDITFWRVLCHVLGGVSGHLGSSPSSAINQRGDPAQAVLPIQARFLLKIGLPALSMQQSLISEVWVGQARKRHSFHSSFPYIDSCSP